MAIVGRVLGAVLLLATPQLMRAETLGPDDRHGDLIDKLLAMPAPPPDWRLQSRVRNDALPIAERDFFDGPPPEDAPVHVLLPYWARLTWRKDNELPPLTENLREKLLQGCEQRPGMLPRVLRFVPDTPDAHERVARLLEAAEQSANRYEDWHEDVKKWLALHSDRFRPQLIARARAAEDKGRWVEGEEALRALAEKDWSAAQLILRQHLVGAQPDVAAVSLAILYLHAAHSEEGATSSQLRDQLKGLVTDRSAGGFRLGTALKTLMATEWPERDRWFLALFSDPTFGNPRGGSRRLRRLAYVVRDNPDYWIPPLVAMVGGEDRAAHNAAVHCLEQFHLENARADALRPLLPWLSNPDWATRRSSTDRLRLIQSLDRLDLPECVEGLIWVAGHDTGYALLGAAQALAHYRAKDAAPVLKAAIAHEWQHHCRRGVIKALLSLDGLSVEEMVEAVELYATETATEEGSKRVKRALRSSRRSSTIDPKLSIGGYLANRWDEPDEEVARRLVARMKELRTSNFPVSQSLWLVIHTWPTSAVDQEIVRRVTAGTVDEIVLRSALQRRESLRRNTKKDLKNLGDRGGARSGIAACLIGAPERYARILDDSDPAAQRALLACARLVRVPLPVPKVGKLLKFANDGVAMAAESYLESEDSAPARQLVLAHHPGEARILGARHNFDPGHCSFGQFNRWEDRLRKAVRADGGPDEVLALLSTGNWGDVGQVVIYIRGEDAELRFYVDESKYESSGLTGEELQELRGFLSDNSVEDLAPLNVSVIDCTLYEYVHVTTHGGRRVFMNCPGEGTIYDQLVRRFTSLIESLERSLVPEEETP